MLRSWPAKMGRNSPRAMCKSMSQPFSTPVVRHQSCLASIARWVEVNMTIMTIVRNQPVCQLLTPMRNQPVCQLLTPMGHQPVPQLLDFYSQISMDNPTLVTHRPTDGVTLVTAVGPTR